LQLFTNYFIVFAKFFDTFHTNYYRNPLFIEWCPHTILSQTLKNFIKFALFSMEFFKIVIFTIHESAIVSEKGYRSFDSKMKNICNNFDNEEFAPYNADWT